VKLSESRFGSWRADDEHRRKLLKIYWARLVGRVKRGYPDEGLFFQDYQIVRNVSCAGGPRGDLLLLVLAAGNIGLHAAAQSFIDAALGGSRSFRPDCRSGDSPRGSGGERSPGSVDWLCILDH
jgi:hypothetical protein